MSTIVTAATRKLVVVAQAVAAFIVANATKIVALATLIHSWTLDKSVATANAKVDKQFATVSAIEAQRNTLEKLRKDALQQAAEADQAFLEYARAVQAEKAALAA